MKVALVYDRINTCGGAERVLQVLHEIWPEAPVFTSVYDSVNAPWAKGWNIKTSFLQYFPWARNHHQLIGWLMPLAFESLDLSEFDVVISVTSEAAKGVITMKNQLHICYLLTPTRYLWSHYDEYLLSISVPFRSFARLIMKQLQKWDVTALKRPNAIISISKKVQERCKKYYKRASIVLYPPMTLQTKNREQVLKNKRLHYLVVSRLVSYKRIDLAIEACKMLNERLIVVGVGSEMSRLKKLAGSNVEFVGHLTDSELVRYYQGAKALIMPQEEDFGLTALEAQYFGTPVVSLRDSGAAESIVEGETGVLFDEQTPLSVANALRRCATLCWSSQALWRHTLTYSSARFKKRFAQTVNYLWKQHRNISS